MWWFLWRTRAGLILRAIGDDHTATHALGLQVRRVRFLRRAVRRAPARASPGAYLSLAYTPFWAPAMTAGRGWIALALVVFASWRPLRVLAGAMLFGGATVLQLHAQAAGLGLPGQALSALPYLATILALVLLSLGQAPGRLPRPGVARPGLHPAPVGARHRRRTSERCGLCMR